MPPPQSNLVAFFNGKLLTMDPLTSGSEVLLVRGDRIEAVGARELLPRNPDAVRVDLLGCWLCPGLIDAHNHLSIAALHPLWADLSNVRTEEELARALREQALRDPQAPWIRPANWNDVDTGLLAGSPNARPVWARPAHSDCALQSTPRSRLPSRARRLGNRTYHCRPRGVMTARDVDGLQSGLLVERAWSEAHARSVAPYRDRDRHEESITHRARVLLRDESPCVHDAASSPPAKRAYARLAGAYGLPLYM